ncbi:unnamed protein product, partial [Rotaria socialis]
MNINGLSKNTYKNKAARPPPTTDGFYFSDIIGDKTSIADNDAFIPVSTTCYDDPKKYHSGRAACQSILIFTLGDDLSHYKENFWSSTDNGCEVIRNYSHDYAFK